MKINRKNAQIILDAGLATGADYAEIYVQDHRSSSYSRRYGKVNAVTGERSCGVGIRLMKGVKQVYGYTSDFSLRALLDLASSLALGFDGERIKTAAPLKAKKVRSLNLIKIPHDAWSAEQKLSYLKAGEDAAFSVSEKVKDVITRLFEEDEDIEVFTSEGLDVKDTRCRTRLIAVSIASDGQQFQQGYEGPGLSKGLEFLEETDFVALSRKVAQVAVDMLSATDGPSGEMPVVIGNGFGGVLFHEACGHPLEGTAICRHTSPFSEKLGKKIASDIVNAYDDGTIENAWGSESVDDEGNAPTKNHLITDGVLTNYMLDRYTARRIDPTLLPTGSCRRESYRYLPTTRMTNTYIDNGTSDPKDIIASVKDGIYCQGFTGGQVDPSTDQFVFTSDVAYTIHDGKIGHLIKPVSLIGYGYEILQRITMVGNDLRRGPGSCGAASGTCFVEVGQPTILISKILVGGAGGNE